MRHPHIFWVPLTISRPKDSSDIFAAHGFNSATKIHELAEEIQADNRHYAFFYVGDYDPSGMYMSEVDLNDRLTRYGASGFSVVRIALLPADALELPSFEASTKAKDPRYRWYVDKYGDLSWELDAMDPTDLRQRVRSHVVDCIDREAWERHKIIEQAQRETTKMVAAQMARREKEMLRWLTIEKFSAESGYTPDAVRSKIKRGDWREGHVWIKAPDGRILIDTEGYEKWVTSQASASAAIHR